MQTQRFVIAVEMDSGDPAESLQSWAKSVYQRMLPGDFPDEVARILNGIARIPTKHWGELCNLEGIYLAIANPPQYRDDWFWAPLLSEADHLRVATLSDQQVTQDMPRNWEVESMGRGMDDSILETAISKAPRLARALAMLNMPLGVSYLSVEAKEEGEAASLAQWPEWMSVMIETAAGPIMTATARQYVLGKIESEQLLTETHLDCLELLAHPELSLTRAIREHRLDHLLGAGLDDEALLEASSLCHIYRVEDRPFSVLRIVERLGPLKTYLPIGVRLVVAWANLQLGKVSQAKYWLQRSNPRELLDIAWKHVLQAEIYKSEGTEGSKENALREIEEAIRVCQEAREKPPQDLIIRTRALAYRQDWCRIKQFLYYDLEEAAKGYERLVQEWSALPDPGIDLAVIKRNYAECLRSLATGPGDSRWRKAQDLLQEAERLARSYPYAPVLSEILYERARAAEKEDHLTEAIRYLEECTEAAITSRHYMMLAIAQNRLFWRREAFSLKQWGEIESALKGFPHHGWAVRALINSRLRVAHILEETKDLPGSFAELEANLRDLERNPSFDKGSDRRRIAATMAGLQLIGEKLKRPVTYWQDILSQYSWARDWLQERSIATAEDLWMELE